MPTAKIYDLEGAVVGEQELAPGVFGMPVHEAVLFQVVNAQQWNRRQGNASTLTRAQVSGGNRKPYRQKGTGHARQGSTRAPQFRHGGSVFGPRPHPYHQDVPRKMRRIALRSALSDKANNERICILHGLTLDAPKTKTMVNLLNNMELTDEVHAHPSTLVLLAQRDENVINSLRNIRYVKVGHVASINVVELLKHDYLMLTPEALTVIEQTYDDGIPAEQAEPAATAAPSAPAAKVTKETEETKTAPAQRPTEKAAEKPAEKPTAKAAEQPAEPPPEKPATRPRTKKPEA